MGHIAYVSGTCSSQVFAFVLAGGDSDLCFVIIGLILPSRERPARQAAWKVSGSTSCPLRLLPPPPPPPLNQVLAGRKRQFGPPS